MPTWLLALFVLIGGLLLMAALLPAYRILRLVPRDEVGWKILSVLIVFFIAGYAVFGYVLYHALTVSIDLIVTLILFASALFVLLVMHMSYRSVRHAQESAERENYRALHDDLTGLPNRTLLRERMIYTLSMSRREPGPFAILLMDLDRFRDVNDSLGHAHGDTLLMQVGPRLRAVVRESDTVARLGGDEFAVLLPGAGLSQATIVANKLVSALERPFEVYGRNLSVGVSIGVCVYPLHGSDVEVLQQRAEIAMYNAKRKDAINVSYAIYDIDRDKLTLENLSLMGELRDAIRGNQLMLHYQPKINLRTGNVCGVEALVRWQHPLKGQIPPDKFILLAEQCGQINALTRWVLNAALQQYVAWRAAGVYLPVAVNISCKDLRDPQLPEFLQTLLARWDVPAPDVTLEFTESSMMNDPERATDVILRLRDTGVKLSIDDFGIGYSSLSHLKRLPKPEIKIDRSFVKNMTEDEGDAIIVRSTIDLAHNMGLTVTAEGVETKDILDLLDILGCDRAQGYHIARPLAAEQVLDWIQTNRPVEDDKKQARSA